MKYVLIVYDYSQIELRVGGMLHEDPTFIKVLNDPKGDIHATTSERFGIPRSPNAKEFNFAFQFGGGAYAIAQQLTRAGVLTEPDEAQKYLDQSDNTYPRVRPWRQELLEEHQENGFIRLLTGRTRFLKDVDWNNKYSRHKAETRLSNNSVQGCYVIDTQVLTSKGARSIRQLLQCATRPDIWDGYEFVPIKDIFPVGKKALYKVIFKDGTVVRCSDEHLWKNELGEWIRSDNLKIGNYVQQRLPKYDVIPSTDTVKAALARIVGFMVGDGSYKLRVPSLLLKKEVDLAQYELRCVSSYFDRVFIPSERAKKVIHFRVLEEAHLRNSALGKGATRECKIIPNWLFKSTLDVKQAFIQGYYLTDGGTSIRNIVFTSVSPHLIKGTQRLLYDLGIRSTYKKIGIYSNSVRDVYRLFVASSDKQKFLALMPSISLAKLDRLRKVCLQGSENKGDWCPPELAKHAAEEWRKSWTYIKSPSAEYSRRQAMYRKLKNGKGSLAFLRSLNVPSIQDLVESNYLQVTKVQKTGKQTEMFDLTVEPRHQYALGNGLICHNCAQDIIKAAMIRLDTANFNIDAKLPTVLNMPPTHRKRLADYARKLERYRKQFRLAKLRMLMQVHDELIIRCLESDAADMLPLIGEIMCWYHPFPFIKPMKIRIAAEGGIGHNWKEAKGKTPIAHHAAFGDYDA